tara:strand:+ start:14285 stop:15541 length:1257 start_codon:yes stop_codon:yes gene_type:complete
MNEILLPFTPAVMLFLALRRSCSQGLLISFQVLIWSVLLFTFSFPFLTNVSFLSDSAVLLFYCAYLSLVVVYLCFDDAKWLSNKLNNIAHNYLDNNLVKLLSTIFIALLILEVIGVVVSSGGVYSALTRNRLEDYLGGGILSGSFMTLLLLLPKIGYFIRVGFLLETGRKKKAFILISIYAIYFVFTANTRLPILMPIASFIILYLFYFERKKVKRYGVFYAATAILILNILLVLGNSLRGGTAGETKVSSESIIAQNTEQLKYPMWINDLVNDIDNGAIDLSHGYSWFITPFVNLVPRILWPEKPLTSTSNILSEKVYGISVGDGKPITTFTLWGEGYWQFKLFGVILATFIFLFVSCFFIMILTKLKYSGFFVVYFLCNITPFVRAESPIFMVLTNLIALAGLFFVSFVLRSFRCV